jgi:signal transduction histidine kinase
MEPVPENIRLLRGAYWLAKLRWVAIVYVVVGTYVAHRVLAVGLNEVALYVIAGLLVVYNTAVLAMLNRLMHADQQVPCHASNKLASLYNMIVWVWFNRFTNIDPRVSGQAVKRIINLQICTDLLLLTALLHFSGGIENPLVFYFIFHMIIASILLSMRESYLQATFAVCLFGLLVLLEYKGLIGHYCLTGFVSTCLRQETLYVLGMFFVFTTGVYLAVYMANYIAIRLKHTEYAYRQANLMLQEKDRIKDQYVLRVTHDIKGHLATIQSCLAAVVDRLAGPAGGAQEIDLIGRAYKRAVKLTGFVKELLRLTQMRLTDKSEMTVFSLREVLDSAAAGVEPQAQEKSITLDSQIDSSVKEMFGDRLSIEEMLTNLLQNAVRYTPEKGSVCLTARNNQDDVLVEIADTGIGIPEAEQSRIFDEFYRATNARKIERDGTGLGLSIVRLIVQRHHGEIRVESKEGCGTRFKIRLPQGRLS